MRLRNRFTLKTIEGARRRRRKFLFRPRQFDDRPTRWLEFSTIIEQVCRVDIYDGRFPGPHYEWKWCEVGFG